MCYPYNVPLAWIKFLTPVAFPCFQSCEDHLVIAGNYLCDLLLTGHFICIFVGRTIKASLKYGIRNVCSLGEHIPHMLFLANWHSYQPRLRCYVGCNFSPWDLHLADGGRSISLGSRWYASVGSQFHNSFQHFPRRILGWVITITQSLGKCWRLFWAPSLSAGNIWILKEKRNVNNTARIIDHKWYSHKECACALVLNLSLTLIEVPCKNTIENI